MGFGILASQASPGWAAAAQKLERGGGELTVPEAPGLGVDVDPAFLKKLKKI